MMFLPRRLLTVSRTCSSSHLARGVSACVLPPAPRSTPSLPFLSQSRNMANQSAPAELRITPIEKDDYEEWERLFRLYIEFYKSSLPDAQYPKTFARILDSQKDLYGLVLRDSSNPKKLYGLAHYFPMQTPWAEELLMHLNGMLRDRCCFQKTSSSNWS